MPTSAWQSLCKTARADFVRDGFCVVEPCLSPDALRAFRAECSALSRGVDLDETECVVDLWAAQEMQDNHPARVDSAEYRQLRARIVARAMPSLDAGRAGEADVAGEDRAVVERTIMGQLASLASEAFSAVGENADSGELTDGIAEAELGDHTQGRRGCSHTSLFNEHYVVKPADSSTEFGWHTDQNEQLQMCLNQPSLPYVSIWLPLCDTEDENGTLEILPRCAPQPPANADKSHIFFRSLVSQDGSHSSLEKTEEHTIHSVGENAPTVNERESGKTCRRIRVLAGGAVIFASDIWHRSGPNRSSEPRQVFYAQYTHGVLRSDGTLGPSPASRTGSTQNEDEGVARKSSRLAGPLSFAVPTKGVE